MTLILAMIKEEGVYLSTDYRLTDQRGRVVDDETAKYLSVHYPPIDSGPSAVLAFTGLAHAQDGTPMMQWIRETIRGEQEPFDASMEHLKQRANRDLGGIRTQLAIVAFLVQDQRRFVAAITNVVPDEKGSARLSADLVGAMWEVRQPTAIGFGSGAFSRTGQKRLDLIQKQLEVKPRRPLDHMKLLAVANEKIARAETTVSPWCHVSFLSVRRRRSEPWNDQSRAFEAGKTEPVRLEMPFVLCGLDFTDPVRSMVDQLDSGTGVATGFGTLVRRRP